MSSEYDSVSPYTPPTSAVEDPRPASLNEAEALREAHMRHEIQIKSVGSLYYFGGAMMLLSSLATVGTTDVSLGGANGAVLYGLLIGLAILMLALGYGLRRLRPWVRIPTAIVSAVGLLGFPVGTLINGYVLYLLFCEKGGVTLGASYRAVLDATPHIKYRRTVGDKIATICLVLIAIFIGVALFAAYSG